MPPPDPPSAEEDPFPSLSALRAEHVHLLGAARREDPGWRGQVRTLLKRGRATGGFLDNLEDRNTAQSLLDYWTATLYTRPDGGGGFEALAAKGPVDAFSAALLSDFDPSASPVLDDAHAPYPGLAAFGEGDRERFFGREETVGLMLGATEVQAPPSGGRPVGMR
jgi:hypothetical protein